MDSDVENSASVVKEFITRRRKHDFGLQSHAETL